jgi:large subunit ribosomal protein L15
MNLSKLRFAPGSKKKSKRIARGTGSGHGGTSTRGHNGAGSRSGTKWIPYFEGGQMPLHRRLPKRGFKNIFRQEIQVVNIRQLNNLKENEIDASILKLNGLINKIDQPVKLLGDGEITRPVKITVDAVSDSAKSKIVAAGGEVVLL